MKTIIEVKVISHSTQRYDTWADWTFDGSGKLTISTSELPQPDWRYDYLSAIHELLEATVCRHMGITQAQVDAFDVDYEARRMRGEWYAACGCRITDDPGSDKHAPYLLAHKYAESVEYGLARLLDVKSEEYDAAYIALDGGVAGNLKDASKAR